MESEALTPPDPGRRSAMRLQQTKDTAPELELRRNLHRRGLRYRLHLPIVPGTRRSVDIVFLRQRVAVDVRGCFWHGCAEHRRRGSKNSEWWDAKISGNVDRDQDTQRRLEDVGWTVIVVWEHEDAREAADGIERIVRSRTD